MILCLAAAHATHHVKPFLIKWAREAFFVISKVLPANIFGNFLFDSPSFINTNVTVINS